MDSVVTCLVFAATVRFLHLSFSFVVSSTFVAAAFPVLTMSCALH